MKFLLIAGFPDSLLSFRGALLDSLLSHGLEVHVAAPGLGPDSQMRGLLESKGILVHDIRLRRTGMNPLVDLVTLFHFWLLMRRMRPDYVLAYTIKPVLYGLLAAAVARVPNRFALITGLGYAFTGKQVIGIRPLLRQLVHCVYGFALRFVQKVFFQNPDDEKLFRQRGLLSDEQLSIVVNGSGVDTAEYNLVPLRTNPRFLLIARLLGDKGVREYVEAACRVKKAYPEVVFQLAGWIDENPDAIKQSELDAWVKGNSIEFLGRLSDVRPAIANASVYVLPSYREGTPRTVLEAMAMGRPIITTDAPGCRETVIDGKNGFLVPVKSVKDLVEAMQRFIENPALISEMGMRSREIAEEKYDVNKVNAVMLREMGIQ